MRRQLPEYSLSASGSAEGGGGGTRLGRRMDEMPELLEALPPRGIVSATVGAERWGLSEPVRACPVFCNIVGLVVDAKLRMVLDRVRTHRVASLFSFPF